MTRWLGLACYVTSAACAAAGVFVYENGYSPWGPALHAIVFGALGFAIRNVAPPRR